MADIIQASKWMREGKTVKRPVHNGTQSEEYRGYWCTGIKAHVTEQGQIGIICDCHGTPKLISLESLLANDWEIAND